MKNIFIGFITIATLFSCVEDNCNFLFDMEYPPETFTIRGGLPVILSEVFAFRNIESNIDFYLTENNRTLEEISNIQGLNARITAQTSQVEFGNFVQEVRVELCDVTTGRCDYEAFYLDNIRFDEGNSLRLIPSLPNLKEFLTQEEFYMRLVFIWRNITPATIDCVFEFSFETCN